MVSEKARENRVRRQADRFGYVLMKDRARRLSLGHFGDYMVVHAATDSVVWGSRFDATLDQIESFLAEEESRLRAGGANGVDVDDAQHHPGRIVDRRRGAPEGA